MHLRKSWFTFFIAALFALAGCSGSQNSEQPSSTSDNSAAAGSAGGATMARRAEAPTSVTVPAGTIITVRLGQSLSSKTAHAGDNFTATVADPVSVAGQVAIPSGASATGTVTSANAQGHFKGAATLGIALSSVDVRNSTYTLSTEAKGYYQKGKGKRSAVVIGGGAGLGALIGGLAGGGKGAAIGAAAGAGAGTAGAAFTGNKEITLPAESAVSFRLTQPVEIKL